MNNKEMLQAVNESLTMEEREEIALTTIAALKEAGIDMDGNLSIEVCMVTDRKDKNRIILVAGVKAEEEDVQWYEIMSWRRHRGEREIPENHG